MGGVGFHDKAKLAARRRCVFELAEQTNGAMQITQMNASATAGALGM